MNSLHLHHLQHLQHHHHHQPLPHTGPGWTCSQHKHIVARLKLPSCTFETDTAPQTTGFIPSCSIQNLVQTSDHLYFHCKHKYHQRYPGSSVSICCLPCVWYFDHTVEIQSLYKVPCIEKSSIEHRKYYDSLVCLQKMLLLLFLFILIFI